MRWVFLLLATAGIVTIVPIVLQALDGKPRSRTMGFVAFTTLTAGALGLLLGQFDLTGFTGFIAAAAAGLAAGAIHPEILNALRSEVEEPTPGAHGADVVADGGYTKQVGF